MRTFRLQDRSRWTFLSLVALVGSAFAFATGKVWLAAHWSASANPEVWIRAARLEPGNASYWHRLGLYEQWDLEHGDLRAAVRHYQQALRTNPRADAYWMDLASAYETLGEITQAHEAFQKARLNYPISSGVAWRYGNFVLRQGDTSEAFAEFRRALAADPQLTASAVSVAWRATHNISRIVAEVLPAHSRHYSIALDYFLSQQEFDAALTVLERLLQLGPHPEWPQTLPLVDGLIAQDRVEDAQRVWRLALGAAGWPQPESGDALLICDGGFERDLANGGFGWRETPVAGASFGFDTAVSHSGARSLRITFDGSTNLDFQHLVQYVAVQPRQRYRFAAYLRTEGISTDSGIRFFIYDVRRPAVLEILSGGMAGSQPWSAVETEFTTGPQTRMVAVVLRRIPSRKFDNRLAGTAWVDDVSLAPVTGETWKESP